MSPSGEARRRVISSLVKNLLFLLILPLLPVVAEAGSGGAGEVSWNFEIRPLLASKCFSCHGADVQARKGKMRLDDLSGLPAGTIVSGHPEQSALMKRVHADDPDEVMPPPAKSAPLSEAEKELLARWIAGGAPVEKHWAFVPPVKPSIADSGRENPIDVLVRESNEKRKQTPAPPASKSDWLRRVSFALTGLPPQPSDFQAFLAAPDDEAAYEAVVDRLLASPHFGEHLAQDWLDAARYGDTYGRHEDADSEVWPWRDWVIGAFNRNLPYHEFIQWQTAGDMLPAASQDQRIATVFNRLCVQSNESGSDPEEFRWEQVFDRVKTNATVFMGLTMECAQCHDHKYDPFSQKEYYQFAAFFNNIDELGLFSRFSNGTPSPTAIVYKDGEARQHLQLKQAITGAEREAQQVASGVPERFAAWLVNHTPPGPGEGIWSSITARTPERMGTVPRGPVQYFSFDLLDIKGKKFIADVGSGPGSSDNASLTPPPGKFGFGAGLPLDKDKKYEFPGIAGFGRTDAFSFTLWLKMESDLPRAVILHRSRAGVDAAHRGYELTLENGRLTATLAHFYPGNAIRVESRDPVHFHEWRHIAWTYDGSSRAQGLKLYLDGKALALRTVRDGLTRDIDYLREWGDLDNVKVADAKAADLISFQIGGRNLDKSLRGSVIDDLKIFDCALTEPEVAVAASNQVEGGEQAWMAWFKREIDGPSRDVAARLKQAREAENKFSTTLRDLMVMEEQAGPRRATPLLQRGSWSSPGEPVSPGTPASLPGWPEGAPNNRLGLAQWLTSPEHPLTSRVEVNRLWRLFFGQGLVATGHDFGIQGSPPALPRLLDWLAVEFRESGWDIKKLCRRIALSQTFRQSSLSTDPAALESDPDNKWLSRGPRLRLSGEQIRDAALALSGLLVPQVGGPSVKPWQPEGLWEDTGTQHQYDMGSGEALHRRSLYTFWRRTCPPPMLTAFDAPSREFCLIQRETSQSPLQTLTLLNDRIFLEASRNSTLR